ncbi:MAG: hypothetical protein AB7Q16_05955 [Vicinamibacterales bacterium]
MAAAVVTIGGTPRTLKAGSLNVIENISRRSTLRCVVESLDGSYTPAQDDEILLEDASSTVLFKGLVAEPDREWVLLGDATLTTVVAEDFTSLADRRLGVGSTTGGIVARDAIDYLVSTYLAGYGVTRDPGMGAGAILGALSYDYVPVSSIINDIVRISDPAGIWLWRIDENKVLTAFAPSAGAYPCPFTLTAAAPNLFGDVTIKRSRQNYANRVILTYKDGTSTPQVVTSDDAAEQAAHGVYEAVIRSDGPLDSSTAQALCDGELLRRTVRPRTLTFRTLTAGARAGQTLTVNLPARGIAADFLITQVEITDFGGRHLVFGITAIEGGVSGPDWRDTYQQWGGGGSAVTIAGGVVVTATVGRATYFLGGSGFAGDQSAGPSVINAVGYLDVMIDKSAIGPSTSVTAVVQCRTADVAAGVTPQVYNVTTAAVAGTGSLVVGTAWTTVTFTITVAAGQNVYRLRLTPDTAGIDVFALGYLEIGR